jgi:hypothetical protein
MASRKAIARKKKSLLPGSRHATVVDISPTGELTVRLATGSLLVCDFSSSWTRFIFAILRSPGSTEPAASVRWSRGVDVAKGVEFPVLEHLDLRARREAILRSRAGGTWSGTYADLDVD